MHLRTLKYKTLLETFKSTLDWSNHCNSISVALSGNFARTGLPSFKEQLFITKSELPMSLNFVAGSFWLWGISWKGPNRQSAVLPNMFLNGNKNKFFWARWTEEILQHWQVAPSCHLNQALFWEFVIGRGLLTKIISLRGNPLRNGFSVVQCIVP
jgi:hypothetical protein